IKSTARIGCATKAKSTPRIHRMPNAQAMVQRWLCHKTSRTGGVSVMTIGSNGYLFDRIKSTARIGCATKAKSTPRIHRMPNAQAMVQRWLCHKTSRTGGVSVMTIGSNGYLFDRIKSTARIGCATKAKSTPRIHRMPNAQAMVQRWLCHKTSRTGGVSVMTIGSNGYLFDRMKSTARIGCATKAKSTPRIHRMPNAQAMVQRWLCHKTSRTGGVSVMTIGSNGYLCDRMKSTARIGCATKAKSTPRIHRMPNAQAMVQRWLCHKTSRTGG